MLEREGFDSTRALAFRDAACSERGSLGSSLVKPGRTRRQFQALAQDVCGREMHPPSLRFQKARPTLIPL